MALRGFFVDNKGRRFPWGYSRGAAWSEDSILTALPEGGFTPRIPHRPVAVLIGPETKSAGEALAVALWGHGSRTFGSATAGLSGGNSVYHLPDGALLALTEVLVASREGQVVQRIEPDSSIGRARDNRRADVADEAVRAAIRCLSLQAPCS